MLSPPARPGAQSRDGLFRPPEAEEKNMADGDMPKKKPLDRDPYRLGNSFVFPPHVMDDIHVKSELGRYRMRGFSLFKKIPHWDDLTFLPGTLTRFVIEGYREKC